MTAIPALRDAILDFVAASPEAALRPFRENVANWGTEAIGLPPRHLPASDILAASLDLAAPATRSLAEAFIRHRGALHWEQTYTAADGLVSADMLAGYGFAEVIGLRGPCVSTRIRAGLVVWGPGIDYPPHRHVAEEAYLVLAGAGEFRLDGEPPRLAEAGAAVHVASNLRHGLRTTARPLAALYLWQGGDLRQKSVFGGKRPAATN